MTPDGMWRVLRPLVRPRRWALLRVLVLFLTHSLTVLAAPVLIGRLIDDVRAGTPGAAWWGWR